MKRSFALVGLFVAITLATGMLESQAFGQRLRNRRMATPAPAAPAAAPNEAASAAAPKQTTTAAAPAPPKADAKATAAPAAPAATVAPSDPSKELPVTYRARQIVHLDDIKPGSKNIRMWVSIPDDEANQRLLNLNIVKAPGKWSIVRDVDNRARFLKVDVQNPKDAALDVEVEFTVTRKPIFVDVDAAKVGPLTDAMQKALAADLAFDSPHMEVSDAIIKISEEVCGKETNLAKQAMKLMEYVEKVADHYSYSKDPKMPKCGIGDAKVCLAQGGGCCTDLHSLFIALARSRGIPARLQMGYRLQEKNLDKMVDPGYRCWVEYFLPNYGWISSDIVEADAPGGMGPARWAHGLTARRVWLNQGRDYRLTNDLAVGRANHMSIAYAEIDGMPARILPEGDSKPQITRTVQFTEVATPTVSPVAASR